MAPPTTTGNYNAFALRGIAYAALGVTERDTYAQPQIRPQLRAIAMTLRRAGQPKVTHRIISQQGDSATIREDTRHAAPYGPGADIQNAWPTYLRAIDDDSARRVLEVYHSLLVYHRKLLPIEAFCLAAQVSPLRILELLTAAVVRMGAQASTVVAAVNQPRVVQKMVEMALTDDGIADRTLLSRATGFLPSPAAAKTQINIQQNASASASAPVAVVAAPPPEQTVRRLVERFHEARGLPAPGVSAPAAIPALTEGRDDAYPVALTATADPVKAAVISRSTSTYVDDAALDYEA